MGIEHVAAYGRFQASTAWYANLSDPFSRGNSVFPWNRQLKKHIGVGAYDNGYEDNRIFNNGLSDEAGAGANLGFAAKVGMAPVKEEVEKLDLYITTTLYGILWTQPQHRRVPRQRHWERLALLFLRYDAAIGRR